MTDPVERPRDFLYARLKVREAMRELAAGPSTNRDPRYVKQWDARARMAGAVHAMRAITPDDFPEPLRTQFADILAEVKRHRSPDKRKTWKWDNHRANRVAEQILDFMWDLEDYCQREVLAGER